MSLAKTGQPDRRLQPMATMPPIPVEELNLREALTWLCAAEIAHKDQRRIAMAMSIAKFPFARTLEGFEYEAQPSPDPGQIRELATCRWVANGDTLLLLGPPGVGKTHLAVALGREAVSKGYTVQYVSAMELISTLARAHNQTALESRLSQYGKSTRRRLRHQQDGATASKDGPDFVSPEEQFRMSLDSWFGPWANRSACPPDAPPCWKTRITAWALASPASGSW